MRWLLMQVVNESSETVYCASDAAARMKQHNSFTASGLQLLYRLDDVSITHTTLTAA